MNYIKKISSRHGILNFCNSDLMIGKSLREYGEFSEIELSGMKKFIKDGDIVLEIGANIGCFTIPFSKIVGKRGKVYENEITWVKNAKIKLPPGQFTLMLSQNWSSWGIDIAGKWLIGTKDNLFHQSLSLDRIGSTKYTAYLKIFYEEIFFRNQHDGCYPRSEYTVMEVNKIGSFFNCFIVRHHDFQKVLYAPDDPQRTTEYQKHVIKKYNLEIIRVVSDGLKIGELKEAYTGNGKLINSSSCNPPKFIFLYSSKCEKSSWRNQDANL